MTEKWVRIGVEGTYGGVRFDRTLFEKLVANFEQDVPIENQEGGDPMGGWVSKLEVREERGCAELWAFTKFFEYVEPVEGIAVVSMSPGEERGPRLISVYPGIRS